MDQPNIHQDVENIQKRWGGILSNSEDRSQKMDKTFSAWTAYSNELENFQESLEKIHTRLANDPNVNTSDVQVLEHELALAKVCLDKWLKLKLVLCAMLSKTMHTFTKHKTGFKKKNKYVSLSDILNQFNIAWLSIFYHRHCKMRYVLTSHNLIIWLASLKLFRHTPAQKV